MDVVFMICSVQAGFCYQCSRDAVIEFVTVQLAADERGETVVFVVESVAQCDAVTKKCYING